MAARRQIGRQPRRCREPLVWLAILAVVTQAVLFELAMAARAWALVPVATHGHAHHGEAPAPKPSPPAHKHEGDCPFCLARAANPPPPALPGIVLPLPVAVRRAERPILLGRIRAGRRPTRFRARSPPLRFIR